jgi:GNAT superfamily N-acetyltransferase
MSEHLSFQVEPFSAIFDEVQPLIFRHWEDLALNKDKVPLLPNWARYRQLEGDGALSIVTARNNGRLVGYSAMILSPGLHYSSCYEARMDIFWLSPEVRGRMGGVRLFRAVEKELQRRGVQRVYVGSKLHKDVGRLFTALGYHPIETWYSKMLGEPG